MTLKSLSDALADKNVDRDFIDYLKQLAEATPQTAPPQKELFDYAANELILSDYIPTARERMGAA